MAKRTPFLIVYADQIALHLDTIDLKYHSLLRDTIEEQLAHGPETETRNRKPLDRPIAFEADWELRLGPANQFRVFYCVDPEQQKVVVQAIGIKVGNRLFVGGKEYP